MLNQKLECSSAFTLDSRSRLVFDFPFSDILLDEKFLTQKKNWLDFIFFKFLVEVFNKYANKILKRDDEEFVKNLNPISVA